jgi:hypothetical protein
LKDGRRRGQGEDPRTTLAGMNAPRDQGMD